jgi:hypothetical protein
MAAASLTSNYNSKINVGANSFVVEMFVYITAYSTGALLWNLNISGSERGYNLEFGSTGAISISASTNGTSYTFTATTTDVVPLNQWVHVVWTRDQSQGSNNTRVFFNGILKYVGTFTGTQANLSTLGPRLGFSAGSGYLSNVRLINGSIPTEYQTSSTGLSTIRALRSHFRPTPDPPRSPASVHSSKPTLLVVRGTLMGRGIFSAQP